MMTTEAESTTDGNLPAARDRFHHAIDTLINPTGEYVANKWAHIPSLYQQLYDEIPGQQGTGNHAARSMPPLCIDAARLIAWIDTDIRKWQPDYDHCQHCQHCVKTPPVVHRLEALRLRRWRPQDAALINGYANQIEQWVTEINTLLTPNPVRALWAADGHGFAKCPACDATMAKKRDNAGEIVGTPALQLANDGSTYCRACNTSWDPFHATWVCRMLGYPLPEGVLA